MEGLRNRIALDRTVSGLASVSLLVISLALAAVGQNSPIEWGNYQRDVNYQKRKAPDGSAEYRDLDFGVSFRLPPHWSLGMSSRWMDPGWQNAGLPGRSAGNPATTVSMSDKHSHTVVRLYYIRFADVRTSTPEEIDQQLASAVDGKTSQRRDQERLDGYHMRAKAMCRAKSTDAAPSPALPNSGRETRIWSNT